MEKRSIKKDIAIIGISCKFAESNSPKAFWENLKNGSDISQFYTDEELHALGTSKEFIENPNYIKLNSFVDGSDSFDYPFFGYTKDEADLMDPQIRILHEQVWLAMEDAGYNVHEYKEKVGLYLAASDNLNWMAHGMLTHNENVDLFFQSHIINKNYVSTLISYNLNLKGPSYVVETACSSSLSTVHLACRALLMRECSIAMAGGACFNTEGNTSYLFEEGMIGSKDGTCRAFDVDSSGTIPGEGSGIVVLKRLEDALRDNDPIYAVIRASATNNDGKRKVGYTAPSVEGQYDCIKQAQRFANINPNDITYIEAHGTATKLGDPIEIEALNKAFDYSATHKCAIGSVKTNLGHLDYAAGIAGVIKTALALENKMIPPSLHYTSPNPEINFEGGPFYVNAALAEWKRKDSKPLLAGINSLGIGGTNVHVILEEAPIIEKKTTSRPYQLLTYSAKSEKSLAKYQSHLCEYLETSSNDFNDIAYTLKVGRKGFTARDYIIATNKEAAFDTLKKKIENNFKTSTREQYRSIVFMFPGQGAQYFKMGLDLYHQEKIFKEIIDNGLQLLQEETGKDFAAILGYKTQQNIDQKLINDTYYTQPLLFLIEYAVASLLIKWGIQPKYMIGHSLGEYTAACISEVFTLKDGIRLIVKRAALMNNLEKGTMFGLETSAQNIKSILPKEISIATINTKDSCVISGNDTSMNAFAEVLTQNGINLTKLKTSHAFHSEMMDAMLDAYKSELQQINLAEPKYSFASNLTGKEITKIEATSPEYWTQHLRNTVKFEEGISEILQKGNVVCLEVGPGRVLSNFVKQHAKFSDNSVVVNVLRHPKEEKNDNLVLTNALGQLWSNGVKINWNAYYEDEERSRVHAPTYAFDTYKLSYDVYPFNQIQNTAALSSSVKTLDEWFYRANWKKSALLQQKTAQDVSKTYLLFSEEDSFISKLEDSLKTNNKVIKILKGNTFEANENNQYTINPKSDTDFKKLFAKIESDQLTVDQIIFNWNLDGDQQEAIIASFMLLQRFCKNIINHFPASKKKITFLSEYNVLVFGNEKEKIGATTSMFLANICAQENPSIFTNFIDINTSNNFESELLLTNIQNELAYNYTNRSIAYRNNQRWIRFYEPLILKESNENLYVKPNKTYIITGGLGEVGKVFVNHLSEKYASRIIILGRSEVPPETAWENYLSLETAEEKTVARIQELKKLKEKNEHVYYYSADTSNFENFQTAIETITAAHGTISGIIHTAGNGATSTFKPIENLDATIAKKQFDPKINGTLNIYEVFKNKPLDFVWITSSLSSILGGLTYGAYAVANKFISAFINSKNEELKNWFTVELDGITEARISHEKLVEVFERSFQAPDLSQLVVSIKDPNKVLEQQSKTVVVSEKSKEEEVKISRPLLSDDYVAPSTETEKKICELLQSFFGFDTLGVLDNFFELGGDSLKAMTLLKRIHKIFEVEIGIEDFFMNPDIQSISKEVDISKKMKALQQDKKRSKTITI